MSCKECDNMCRQGRDCPYRKIADMPAATWIMWAVAACILLYVLF